MTPGQILCGVCAYLFCISAGAVWMTVSDKRRAQKHRARISESSLLWVAVFGGALAEYLTMLLIRHKTLHRKFMIGLPLILLLHLLLAVFLFWRFQLYPAS